MDELIKALRNCEVHGNGGDCRKECLYVDHDCGVCKHDVMLHDAADAIERLTAEREQMKDKLIQRICQHCDSRMELCEGCPIIAEVKGVFDD